MKLGHWTFLLRALRVSVVDRIELRTTLSSKWPQIAYVHPYTICYSGRKLQMRQQVLRLRGSQNAVSHFAQDDKVVGLESKDTTARQER